MAGINIQRQSVSWLVAEFIVVVVGVGVALAADNWRETFNNRIIEREYLGRLLVDFRQDVENLGRGLSGVESSIAGASALIEYLEGEEPGIADHELVEYFMRAASTGSNLSERIRNDTTYTELVSTGNLNLITDTSLRSDINSYYWYARELVERREVLTTAIWTKYRMLTGENSGRLVLLGEMPSDATVQRLINELNTNEEIVQDFRLLKANLSNFISDYPDQLELAQNLITDIQNQLDI